MMAPRHFNKTLWPLHGLMTLISFASCALRRDVVPAHALGNASWPYQTFETANFTPPVLQISQVTDSSEGYYFIAPDGATVFETSPLIMDVDGQLVWNGPRSHAFNFGVQMYNGDPVLVGWNGTVFSEPYGYGLGMVKIWNKHYEEIAVVSLAGTFLVHDPDVRRTSNVDLHEMYITPRGTALITANNITRADLTSIGGPADGWVQDCQFYEVEIATNEILNSWKSLEHLDQVPFSASVNPLGARGFDGTTQQKAWEYFHINSVAPYDGGYLVSSRFLCSAIAVDRSGRVRWRLQGRDGGDFVLGDGAGFCYQHDIRLVQDPSTHNNDTLIRISLHNNANDPIDLYKTPTTGKILDIDLVTKRVTLKQQFLNTTGPTYSTAQGSFQSLSNGNVFLGHGFIPVSQEFSPTGEILSTIQYGAAEARPGGGFLSAERPTLSYRSFKQHWVGCPKTKPSIYVGEDDGQSKLFISWNGATEVQSWAIFSDKGLASYVKTVAKTGFETAVDIPDVKHVLVRPVFRAGSLHSCGEEVHRMESDLIPVRQWRA